MNTAQHARKNPDDIGAEVTVKEVNYVTLRIAQPEQYVKDFGGTFGYVEVVAHG